jgi:hypothetical protein
MEVWTTRFWIAGLVTGMDIAVFEHFFDVIWLAWSGVEWIRVVLFLTLVSWTSAAPVLCLHVYYGLRWLLYEPTLARTLNASQMSTELWEDSDV